jgi:hypothetical protein
MHSSPAATTVTATAKKDMSITLWAARIYQELLYRYTEEVTTDMV